MWRVSKMGRSLASGGKGRGEQGKDDDEEEDVLTY